MFAVPSPSAQSNIPAGRRDYLFFAVIFAVLLAARLSHSGVLWAEEDLPLAAALQLKRGSVLYRDIWFDKPPLVPAIYLLWGAAVGPVLRVAGALYALAACAFAYGIGATLWTRREAWLCAGLLGFFLTFDTHSAVLPLAADLLLLAPHLAAIFFAIRKQTFWAGFAAGVGFLFNTKGALVLAACALFSWPSVVPLLGGFAVPNLIALGWLAADGAFPAYIDQVWRWPAQYAASPLVSDPVRNGLARTLNWLGFHAALVLGAVLFWVRERRWRFIAWAIIGYAGVALGWRFFPRYFFLLLPALVISAAGGFRARAAPGTVLRAFTLLAALTLCVPAARFLPRYLSLANWADLSMDRDSRNVSALVKSLAPANATLYVWGYRPEIYVYTGLRPATRYLECQAMTGVPADRHLTQSDVVLTRGTREARADLARSAPDVVVDGLTPFNPALSMSRYPELAPWLGQYREAARTRFAIVYLRNTMR